MMNTEAAVRKLKEAHSAALLRQRGVCGVGVEKDSAGGFVLTVHLSEDSPAVRESVRSQVGAAPVKLVVSGPFQKQ
jgi:hypothetical protein